MILVWIGLVFCWFLIGFALGRHAGWVSLSETQKAIFENMSARSQAEWRRVVEKLVNPKK